MSFGIAFEDTERQVRDLMVEIRALEEAGHIHVVDREQRDDPFSGRVTITTRYSNGCEVELERVHGTGIAGHRDVPVRITMPAVDRAVPPSPANAENRALLIGSGVGPPSAPRMIRDRADFDSMFGPGTAAEDRRRTMARSDPPRSATAALAQSGQRHPNPLELEMFRTALIYLMSNPGTILAEQERLSPWQIEVDLDIQDGEGGIACGSMMYAFLSRVSGAGETADKILKDREEAAKGRTLNRPVRKMLDT